MSKKVLIALVAIIVIVFIARRTEGPTPFTQILNQTNPIEALDTVFLEEMTWIEARDALVNGKRTVLIPVGGVEQNGPYMALGRHNYILRFMMERIARVLGDTVVAPIIPFSPEGAVNPPSGHMMFPGTISIRPETLSAIVNDTAQSLRAHGFTYIFLLGDSFDAQEPLRLLAQKEAGHYRVEGRLLHFLPEYYDYDKLRAMVSERGIVQHPQLGIHDDLVFSAILALIDPTHIRLDERMKLGLTSVNGVSLLPLEETLLLARDLVDARTSRTVTAIKAARDRAR